MPAGIARVELVFEQEGYGWTENYFIPDASSTLSNATSRSVILISKRRDILGLPARITYRSISDTEGQRAGVTYPVSKADGEGAYLEADKEATAAPFPSRQRNQQTQEQRLPQRHPG